MPNYRILRFGGATQNNI
ncbi:hypothetical protein YPPY96_1448, partial [Yersinia pestis PY-96]